MSSIYLNKNFATFWNERAGDEGEPYKKYVLDPIMLNMVGSLQRKVLLELGCGNGYLAAQFLKQHPKKIILADISKHNLSFAAKRITDTKNIELLRQDATKKWNISSASLDIIYSNMMLNEVKNITTPIQEAHRCLKRNGQFIFSVTHPAWDLFVYAQELAGKPSTKIKNLGNYFRRGFASFMMSGGDKSNPHLADTYKQEFAIEHFQRPLSDYVHALTYAGFEIKEIVEPPLTRALLKHAPRFSEYGHHPIGLIFWCKKQR